MSYISKGLEGRCLDVEKRKKKIYFLRGSFNLNSVEQVKTFYLLYICDTPLSKCSLYKSVTEENNIWEERMAEHCKEIVFFIQQDVRSQHGRRAFICPYNCPRL